MKSGAKDTIFFLTAIIFDLVALLVAFTLSYLLRFSSFSTSAELNVFSYRYFIFISLQIIIIWILVGYFAGAYDTKKIYPIPEQSYDIFRNTFISIIVALALTFFYRPFSYSRVVLIFAFFFILFLTTIEKMLFRTLKSYLFKRGKFLTRIIVLGENPILQRTIDVIEKDREMGFEIVEVIESKRTPKKNLNVEIRNISEKVKNYNAGLVVMAFPFERHKEINEVLLLCRDLHINFLFVPDLFEIMISKVNQTDLGGIPFFVLRQAPLEGWYGSVKRIMDVIFSTFFLIITAPLFILIPIAIKLNSKGSVFYLQRRVGKGEGIFGMVKFRSMLHNAEKKTGPVWAAGKRDPRITKVGSILRATHFDEIPQLLNVLKNDMSLVGPRPERPAFVDKLKNRVGGYILRHAVKPGLTGIAQLEHKPDSTIKDVKIKLQYDRYYMENASFKLDFILIVRTILGLLRRKK